MSTVTLEAVQKKQAELAAMIEQLKACPAKLFIIPEVEIEVLPGERYAGVVLDADGFVLHHLILLPGVAEGVSWPAAKAWAVKVGGELPTRQEQALLYANLKAEFQLTWYWSGQEYEGDGSYAWLQSFGYGSQDSVHKSYEGRARAVRRFAG